MKMNITYDKFSRYAIIAISLLAVFIHVGNYTIFTLPSIQFYACHLLLGLLLIFLYKPLGQGKNLQPKTQRWCHIIDWVLIVLSIVVSSYVIFNFETYVSTMQNNVLTIELYVLGVIITGIVLEAGRRVLGNTLPIIALLAILYALLGNYIPGLFGHRGYTLRRIALAIFSDRGVYGTPIGTSATNVYLFLLFAAFLNASGADVIFQNIAIALAGKKRGGPAKMAVIASAFFGTISGSCVANVVSTGAFTIPLMKRSGYKKAFAGAVEAVASTGGQIMPPIMGAAAFVLADIASVSYAKVCAAAFLPAVMYYVCLLKMVDLEAVKYNLKGIDPSEVPSVKESLLKGMKLFVPVGVLLVTLLGLNYTPMKSAVTAIFSIIIFGVLNRKEPLTKEQVLNGCLGAGHALCSVVGACATAGIVVAIFSLTGLGLKFSNFLVMMGGNSLVPSLVLSMLVCSILGMGLPTTAAYIVVATAIAPALVKLGLPVLAAHLFLLYFACISAITPPVAVASYAAAGIAEENPMKVGWMAVKLGITGFILPFAFAFNTDYITFNWDLQTLLTWLSGMVICYSLAIVLQGYVEKKITVVERLLYVVAIVLTIPPHVITSVAGIVLFAVLYGYRKREARNLARKTLTETQTLTCP
jgi:TRAP transporter 4TM/12TM fusion protein